MKNTIFLPLVGLLLLLFAPAATFGQKGANDSTRWEKAIAAFEAEDKAHPPAKGQIEFIGSSTIVRWKSLAQDFPEHQILNRGFGGSQIADSTYYAERVIIPYAPRAVFLRAGSNDLNAGKSVEQVFADYKDFVAKVHGKLPQTDIIYIALCPSIARWKQAEKEQELNRLVREFSAEQPHRKYVESYDLTLGADGQPRAELFVADKLHLSPAGYKLLVERIRPHLPH